MMSIVATDWHIGFDCRLKRRFTLNQLAPVLHADGGPESVLARYRGLTGDAEGSSEPLRRTTPAESGLQETVVLPVEAVRRAEAARRFRRSCRDCPANLGKGRDGFGCYGALDLPVSGDCEEALMAVIVRIMEGGDNVDTAADVPVRHIWDNGLTGEVVTALRPLAGWFERTEPVVARVGPFLEKRDISSDQVLELFLGRPRFAPEYSVLFQGFLGEFPRLAGELGAGIAAAAAPLSRFFKALLLAADLGVTVHLTPLSVGEVDIEEEASLTNESLPAMELGLIDGG